ncbi:helix-turn-helix transcriptional regulator [Streptomyces cucumeris]|uniref:helix-turn-helix transcriptional regulator n=1 Tax=Streptomyces cucumeris TaxID=2962890 RepID=UPI003EC01F28
MSVHTAGHRQTVQQRRRPELAAFLRSRRARVTPADVGMAPGLRRRTPGLRREEVAQLSGVGVTWYTWLEQGRPINASVQVLDAVARTLRLDPAEREHLYHLAEVPYVPDRARDAGTVGPEVQGILDALDPLPAVVYNARYDILAYNAGYQHLFPSMLLTSPSERNVLWQLFVNQRCCVALHNLDQELPVIVGTLRGAYGRHLGEPAWEEFLTRLLAASDHFARLWRTGDVAPPGSRIKVVQHASVGAIRLISTSMQINGAPENRVVVYTPDGEESRLLLERLRGIHDPLIGCSAHVRPLSVMRAARDERARSADRV